MARPISDEELQLKKRARRRLVGAIVLVSTVAVVLPMVLDSEPGSVNQNVDIHIPAPDSTEFKSKAVSPSPDASVEISAKAPPGAAAKSDTAVPATTNETGSALPSYTKAEAALTSAPAPVVPPVTAAEPGAAASAAMREDAAKSTMADAKPFSANSKDAPKVSTRDSSKVSPKEAANGAFVVQVAALADAARVKQLQKQMTSAGVKTYTEVVSTKTGEVTRVRAGPYTSREAAEKARAQLKKVGLDGKVVPK